MIQEIGLSALYVNKQELSRAFYNFLKTDVLKLFI